MHATLSSKRKAIQSLLVFPFLLFVLMSLHQNLYAQPLPELIYFRFNAATGGNVTNDAITATRVSNNGTLSGTTVLGGTGIAGTALQGNGGIATTNSIDANWPLNLSGPWTMFIWFKGFNNTLVNNYCFGGQGGSAFRAFTGSGLVSGAGNLLIRGTGMTDVLLNGVFNATGSPVAIHLVYNPATLNIRAYVNGVLFSTVAQTATMVFTGTNFRVGGYATNNGTPTGGFIDEFRLYNRALSQAEITATWNIELSSGPPCAGMPAAGTINNPGSACPSTNFNMSLAGHATGSGITYQWQSKPTSGSTYANITGATLPTITTSTTVSTDYRCIVACTNSGLSATTPPVTITMNSFNICYCKGSLGGSIATSIDSVSILQTTLNNASPGAAVGFYTQYPQSGNTTATLQAGGLYTAFVKYGGNAIGSAWLDVNKNGVFENAEWIQINTSGTTGLVTFQVPPTALLGTTGLRIRSATAPATNGAPNACTNFATGETEDYIVTIVPPPVNDIKMIGYITPTETKLCPFKVVPIKAVIYNNGTAAQTGFSITTNIVGPVSTSFLYSYAATLSAFKTDTITLANHTFSVTGLYDLKSYVKLTNDVDVTNDSTGKYNFTIVTGSAIPVAFSDSACYGEEALIRVLTDTVDHKWYTTPTYSNLVFTGDTMRIPNIQRDSFLYVSSKPKTTAGSVLATINAPNNSCTAGAMFEIIPSVNMSIDSFASLFTTTGSQVVNVYYRVGTYLGFENNAAAWALLGSTTVNATSTTVYQKINVGNRLQVLAGQKYGIYLNYNSRYTNGTNTWSNADLTINAGAGFCTAFTGAIAGRMFNGQVYYGKGTTVCESPLVPIAAYAGPKPLVNLGSDLTVCEDLDVILDAGYPGGSYIWNTVQTTQTISVKNSPGTYWVEVNKYCKGSDTVNISLEPLPFCTGVSYSRIGNTYTYNAAGIQNTKHFLWMFGDGTTDATSYAPQHTYATSGSYKVLLILYNDCGADTTSLIIPLGVPNTKHTNDNIVLYPNPASDRLTLDFGDNNAQLSSYEIVSSIGNVVMKQQDVRMTSGKANIDISALPAGNYIIKLISADATVSKPFVVNR